MRRMCSLLVSAMLGTLVAGTPVGAQEFRGLYVDAFHPGFKTHDEVTQMVQAAKDANFNALIVQVRKRGDAYYNSHIEPKAWDIAPDYDPLGDIIKQAHAAGLEVHAWVCVYKLLHPTKWYDPPANHVYRLHPEWLTQDSKRSTLFDTGDVHLDPGVPAVQDHLVAVVMDIVQNYHVDGIHLENLRYPNKDSGYNPTSVQVYNKTVGGSDPPEPSDEAWCQWRREQITSLVRRLAGSISSTKPAVKFSTTAVAQSPELASTRSMQDWGAWTREGLVDFVVPMLYITIDALPVYVEAATRYGSGRHIYIGIGAFRIPAALACKHITDTRATGADGVVVYNYDSLGPNSQDPECTKLADLAMSVFASPEAVPTMDWKPQPE